MKILYITNKPIYPKIDGGCVAMDNFLKCLIHKKYQVKHLLTYTDKHPFNVSNYPENLARVTDPEGVYVDTKVTPSRAAKNLFKSGSYNVNRFYNKQMERLIVDQLKDNYDAVIMESLYITPYLKAIKEAYSGKLFIRTHNVESQIWEGLSTGTKNLAKRSYLSKLAKDLQRYECSTLNEVNGILSISEDDTQLFKSMGIKVPIETINVTVDTPDDTPFVNSEKRIFHLGAMNWGPNIEAVEKLVKLFPLIRKKVNTAELHIAGSQADSVLESDIQAGVTVHGYVEDPRQFSMKHGILVSPLTSGSGVRIKLLEAMSWGIPCVTTTIGAQGIDHTNSNCIVVADSDDELINATVELLNNEQKREEIGKNAIDYIRKNHNIEAVSNRLVEFIERT